jgi:hypothetical protein
MATRTQTVTVNATPGDATAAAMVVADAHRSQGKVVTIGKEYEQPIGHKAGLLSVDLTIEDAPPTAVLGPDYGTGAPRNASGPDAAVIELVETPMGETGMLDRLIEAEGPLIVEELNRPTPFLDAVKEEMDLSLGPDATTEDSETFPRTNERTKRRGGRPRKVKA